MLKVSKKERFFVGCAQRNLGADLTKKRFCHKMNDERKAKSIKEEIYVFRYFCRI